MSISITTEEISPEKLENSKWFQSRNKIINPDPYLLYGPSKCTLPKRYEQYSHLPKNISVREDDVWVLSFPKCGTTWTQELVWLICNNLDFKMAEISLPIRFPFIEYHLCYARDTFDDGSKDSYQKAEAMASPRFIKCHLPKALLPNELFDKVEGKGKIVYVARNPRDVVVSYYHHLVLIQGFSGTLDDFIEAFVQDLIPWSPYWTHIREFWEMRNNRNILFLTYEDMKNDLKSAIIKTSNFLGKKLSSEEIEKLMEHLRFEKMKENPAVNYKNIGDYAQKLTGKSQISQFIRKGKVGSWKEETISERTKVLLDNWINENKIPGLFDDFI